MRGTWGFAGITAATLLAGCAGTVVEPSEDELRQALARRGGMEQLAQRLTKGSCVAAEDGRYICDYALPDCPPYKPRCDRTRGHRARFAQVAGGWQYVGAVK